MVNQLLIHLIIISFPIFIQQFFYARKKIIDRIRYQVLNGFVFGAASILCMAYPVYVTGSFHGDLRSIPLIVLIIYGYKYYLPGVIALAVAVLYCLYIGGDDVVLSTASLLLSVGPCFFFLKSLRKNQAAKRMLICMILSINSVIVLIASLFLYLESNPNSIEIRSHGIFIMVLAASSFIGMGISTLLKEHFIETAYLKHELERSERLKIVSQIAASVAHEVRNPLTVVKGFLQLLKESVDDKRKDYLNIALSELDRAEYIISDYLNLAKPQADQLEIIEVSEFLVHTLEIMNSYGLIQNVQIHLNCNQTDLYVWANKPKLTQVILNLIKNGVEAIPDKGEVTVNAYYYNEEICIEIIDTGKGISKEELEQLGTVFFTTKESGTGLGILVTYRIVEALKGKIAFQSELGIGTKVLLRFPAVEPEN
ncbi:ATP-binding protein [Bacillus sp. FJAT-28004]|uniref:ATP-binding protein n=1 Tax=Bacillus sp. FJAT-28004 TaxID=1679165 RepID=UPI0006B40665|nr:ATP-binding protein [Bacillus sp. FJAT-28004]